MEHTIIRLQTLDIRSFKRRVFSDDEWQYLHSLPTIELWRRVHCGQQLIGLLHHPAMLNMTQKEADFRSSNLHYQIEAILSIINKRMISVDPCSSVVKKKGL